MDWECMGNGLMDWWISVMLHSDFCLHPYRWTKRVRCPDKSDDFLIFFAFASPPWVIRLYLQPDRCCARPDTGRFGCRLLFSVDLVCQFHDLCLHLYRCTKRVRCRTNGKI